MYIQGHAAGSLRAGCIIFCHLPSCVFISMVVHWLLIKLPAGERDIIATILLIIDFMHFFFPYITRFSGTVPYKESY